jgi:hypothetical protein
LTDYEPEELEQERAARAFLRDALPGVDGLVDTNHHEILQARDFLTLVDSHPGWDWRRQPSTDLP